MVEAVGLAASVIAIIDLSAKVATLCLQYSTAVGNAKADITRLQTRLDDLGTILEGIQHLLKRRNNEALAMSRKLADSLDGCMSELAQLQSRLDPVKAGKAMRRFGFRALKWPFHSKEVSGIVSNLERYERTLMCCLQVDQTIILSDIYQRKEGVSLQPEGNTSLARTPCFSPRPPDRDRNPSDRPDTRYVLHPIE
ncbi:Helo-like-N domain-containing protein [Fusarium keratoplasticum]|nr:Helo-like-N domain-containing protein [Fusarium keratoplasticum]